LEAQTSLLTSGVSLGGIGKTLGLARGCLAIHCKLGSTYGFHMHWTCPTIYNSINERPPFESKFNEARTVRYSFSNWFFGILFWGQHWL